MKDVPCLSLLKPEACWNHGSSVAVYGAEGAIASSLGQAKRSPRSQRPASEIGPEGTGANAAPFFRPFRTDMGGGPATLGLRFACPRLIAIAPLARDWQAFRQGLPSKPAPRSVHVSDHPKSMYKDDPCIRYRPLSTSLGEMRYA